MRLSYEQGSVSLIPKAEPAYKRGQLIFSLWGKTGEDALKGKERPSLYHSSHTALISQKAFTSPGIRHLQATRLTLKLPSQGRRSDLCLFEFLLEAIPSFRLAG